MDTNEQNFQEYFTSTFEAAYQNSLVPVPPDQIPPNTCDFEDFNLTDSFSVKKELSSSPPLKINRKSLASARRKDTSDVNFDFNADLVLSLRLTEIRIPAHIVKDSTAQLECHYDLGNEVLYSVKWYKDGNEFYRYVPRDTPPGQTFLLPGVSVDIYNSTDKTVILQSVNISSSGRYRCEVSAEAPSFQTVSDHGDMIVVALPEEGPRITGGRPRYQIGDMVRVNCTSGRSKPASHLSWFINGNAVDQTFLRVYPPIVDDGLETSILGLEFKVLPKHFKRSDMKLKCLAKIASVYWRSNEESVEGDKQQKAPVLEIRGTVSPSNSRADRVQAGSSSSLHHNNLISEFHLTKFLINYLQYFLILLLHVIIIR